MYHGQAVCELIVVGLSNGYGLLNIEVCVAQR